MHEPVNTCLIDDEDDEMTTETPPNQSSTSIVDEERPFDSDTQQPVSYPDVK